MEFLDKIKGQLFKSYKNALVEYHAGGFFVRKQAIYIYIDSHNNLVLLNKKEGQHPFDSDYSRLLLEDLSHKECVLGFASVKGNLASFKNEDFEIKIMPSIFIENLNNNPITEIIVDWGAKNFSIFSLINVH